MRFLLWERATWGGIIGPISASGLDTWQTIQLQVMPVASEERRQLRKLEESY